jgi:NTE family protein
MRYLQYLALTLNRVVAESRGRVLSGIGLATLILIFGGSPLLAQSEATEDKETKAQAPVERPRIGLVLGGGGARGVAHVGVLRVLDELRVPVDFVSGTSMGAIIAALFALGFSPDEIEARVLSIDWVDLFSDTPDRFERTYRRKEDDHAYFFPVEFGFKNGFVATNRGIIAGQKLSFAVPDPDIYTRGHRSFDHLAYPLRVVGTDLHTGEMVILDRGNLLQAVRASMSIPGLFPPVQWEGRQLIDGGVVRNLPVDVVRDMGAEYIIAVDVVPHPEDAEEGTLWSFLGILSQTLTIQVRENVLDQLQDADLAIEVDLGDFGFKDFRRVEETIAPGVRSAQKFSTELQALALSAEDYADHLRAHRLPDIGPLIVDSIEIDNTSPTADQAIRRWVHQSEGSELDLTVLKTDLAKIYDMGVTELVDFAVSERDDRTVLTVQANGKYYAPHIFRVGASYTGGQQGRSYLTGRLRHTWMEVNELGAEWRNDVQLGRVAGIRSEFYQPLAAGRQPFVAVGGKLQESVLEWYEDLVEIGEYIRTDIMGTADLGLGLWNFGEVRAGVRYGHLGLKNKSTTFLQESNGLLGGYQALLGVDLLDDPVFPTHGVAGKARLFLARRDFGGALNYDRLQAGASAVGSLGNNSFSLGLEGGSSLGSTLPAYEEFTVGGLFRLSGYHQRQIHGPTFGLVSGRWYRKISSDAGLFSTAWYVGLGVEAGDAWAAPGNARLDDLRTGFHITLMTKTYLGPGILAYGRAHDGHDAVYLLIGSTIDYLN